MVIKAAGKSRGLPHKGLGKRGKGEDGEKNYIER